MMKKPREKSIEPESVVNVDSPESPGLLSSTNPTPTQSGAKKPEFRDPKSDKRSSLTAFQLSNLETAPKRLEGAKTFTFK